MTNITPLSELKEILNNELFNDVKNFTTKEALDQLKIAKQSKTLGEQFKSILMVVNRYNDPSEKKISKGLLQHEAVLKLIKTINRPNDNICTAYDNAVNEFKQSL